MSDLVRILIRKLFPPLFTIRIRDSEVSLANGKLTSAFLRDCSDIARKNGIACGWIWGYNSSGAARIEFSSNISQRDRQRFRNAAGVHGV